MKRLFSARVLVPLLVAIVAIAIFVIRTRAPVDVETAQVDHGVVIDEVLGVGAVESDQEVRTAFTATGRLVELSVDEGDQVVIGQRLGTIDLAVSKQDVETARAGEVEAGAAIRRATADRNRARSALQSATRERVRTEGLHASGVLSRAELDAAIDRETLARDDLAARDAALAQTLAARQVAKHTTVSREARAADHLLTSPLDGLVVRRHVDPGDVVAAGTPVLTLAAANEMRIRAWVDETALARLTVGQAARVVFRSEPEREYAAFVTRVGRTVDRQTHELLVDLVLDDPPPSLSLGQRADVWIALARADDVLRVPRGFCDEAAATCTVVRDERAVVVPVGFGLFGRTHVEVREGLDTHDVVVRPLGPGQGLVGGRRVRSVGAS